MCPQEKMIFVNTTTIKYDDFIGHKEQLRIAPCRRCARIGKAEVMERKYTFDPSALCEMPGAITSMQKRNCGDSVVATVL